MPYQYIIIAIVVLVFTLVIKNSLAVSKKEKCDSPKITSIKIKNNDGSDNSNI